MKIECPKCGAAYPFKDDKLPDKTFSFRCKTCNNPIQVLKSDIERRKNGPFSVPQSPPPDAAGKEENNPDPPKKWKVPPLRLLGFSAMTDRLAGIFRASADGVGGASRLKLYRILSISAIVLLALVIGGGAVAYLSVETDRSVSFNAVKHAVDLSLDPLASIQEGVPEVKLSGTLRQYLDGDNKQVFFKWLESLNPDERRDFIENMEEIINLARKKDPDHVIEYINSYQRLKFQKTVENRLQHEVNRILKIGIAMAMTTLSALVGVFVLLLLLLRALRSKGPLEAASSR
jgi:predicted Zn finger-like uncharacterized protein